MTEKFSAPFVRMSERIARNDAADFCGAFCIVAPDGKAVELLLLDAEQNPAMFWSLVETKAKMALAEIDEAERLASGYGSRR